MIHTIRQHASQMTRENLIAIDSNRIREDLCGCYQDIRQQLRQSDPEKTNIIYDYADLLQQRIELWNPEAAYEAGAVLSCYAPEGETADKAFSRYMFRVAASRNAKDLDNRIQRMFDEIGGLLGNTRGLIIDFTELYTECNGTIFKRIFEFFEMGYQPEPPAMLMIA